MQEFSIEDIKIFAETVKELYKALFARYRFLKPVLLKAMLYDNGNYGLVITEDKRVMSKYSIFQSSEGFIIKRNIQEQVHLRFEVEAAFIHKLIANRMQYHRQPLRLLRYFPQLVKGMSVPSLGLYTAILKGNKVVLRPFEDRDMSYLLDWYNDYELNRLAGWSSSKITASKLKYNMVRSFGCDPMNLMIDNLSGKPIGTIQLYELNNQDKSCKLGIRIGDRDYWSKGYGGDAVHTIVQYAFCKLDMYRVDLRVYEYNERAARCYQKCGFKFEGRTRKSAFIDGSYYDEILMGLLKSDFLSQRNGHEQ
jgi:RimJ/RimL family protein N-acetyltransferase